MQRAAVIIGVSKTGQLQQLQAVASGVERMRNWCTSQGFQRIEVLTDAEGKLQIQKIKDVIKDIVDATTYEQLVVYFAGHGVNIAKSERWLLSDAPGDSGAAVNVPGSELQARFCGIPHVVFFSDACRTAADGIQAQGVVGNEIFPNIADGGKERPVDLFWAARLGSPSLEIKDPKTAANAYKAVYTEALANALNGEEHAILQPDGGEVVIRPGPLADYLERAVPSLLQRSAIAAGTTQEPDARITSRQGEWLSHFPAPAPPAPPAPMGGAPDDGGAPGLPGAARTVIERYRQEPRQEAPPVSALPSLQSIGSALISEALEGKASTIDARVTNAPLLTASIAQATTTFGPMHFETQCGFKVRGAVIADAHTSTAAIEKRSGDVVSIMIKDRPAANVLITFTNGTSVVLPALRQHLAALTFNDGELTSVAYEPADTSGLWSQYDVEHLRNLRAAIAAAARFGVFRLEGDSALKLAQQIQGAKTNDPSMALYAAYAYHDLHERPRIAEMQDYFFGQFRVLFFDLAMLARTSPTPTELVFPFFPMLSQGWPLLRAFGARVPPALDGAESDLMPSLWTLFGPNTTKRLQRAWQNGEVS